MSKGKNTRIIPRTQNVQTTNLVNNQSYTQPVHYLYEKAGRQMTLGTGYIVCKNNLISSSTNTLFGNVSVNNIIQCIVNIIIIIHQNWYFSTFAYLFLKNTFFKLCIQ